MSVAKVMTETGWQDLQMVGPQGPQGPQGPPGPAAAVQALQSAGPWPKSWTVNVPFKSDILIVTAITLFASGVAMSGMRFEWDGAALTYWADMFFNEANSHKSVQAINKVTAALPGNHTLSAIAAYGNVASDTNDRCMHGLTFVPVP